MALLPVEKLPVGEQWFYELKWDGFRCQAFKCGNNVRLFSRNGNDFTDKWPEVADAVASLRVHTALLDGEIVALDAQGRPCFQKLQNGNRDECHICFYAFDLLHTGKESLLWKAVEERKARLAELIRGTRLRLSGWLSGAAQVLQREITERRLEGIVAKRRGSFYEAGKRSGAWVKWKALQRAEFIIGGYRPCDRSFDCLLVGAERDWQLHFVGKVQAGFTPRVRRLLLERLGSLHARRCPFVNLPQRTRGRWRDGITAEDMLSYRWVLAEQVVAVGFMEWTEAGLLRNPRISG
jgi:bifunctional non-homologous end joining protein LigD